MKIAVIILAIIVVVGLIISIVTLVRTNKEIKEIDELKKQNSQPEKPESFTTPNAAWNDAASYTNRRNYLLTTEQNNKFMRAKPGYLPGRNMPRGPLAMNRIAPSSSKMTLPDENSYTGYRNTVGFPGPINPTSMGDYKPSNPTVEINIPGAEIKVDKTKYVDNTPIVKQKPTIPNEGEDVPFSANPRVNATSSVNMTPAESTADQVIQQFMTSGGIQNKYKK